MEEKGFERGREAIVKGFTYEELYILIGANQSSYIVIIVTISTLRLGRHA